MAGQAGMHSSAYRSLTFLDSACVVDVTQVWCEPRYGICPDKQSEPWVFCPSRCHDSAQSGYSCAVPVVLNELQGKAPPATLLLVM
jgi:hypothetical protein